MEYELCPVGHLRLYATARAGGGALELLAMYRESLRDALEGLLRMSEFAELRACHNARAGTFLVTLNGHPVPSAAKHVVYVAMLSKLMQMFPSVDFCVRGPVPPREPLPVDEEALEALEKERAAALERVRAALVAHRLRVASSIMSSLVSLRATVPKVESALLVRARRLEPADAEGAIRVVDAVRRLHDAQTYTSMIEALTKAMDDMDRTASDALASAEARRRLENIYNDPMPELRKMREDAVFMLLTQETIDKADYDEAALRETAVSTVRMAAIEDNASEVNLVGELHCYQMERLFFDLSTLSA